MSRSLQKQSGSWAGTQWARDLPGLGRRVERVTSPLHPFPSLCNLVTHSACCGGWTDTPVKAFLIISPFLFQGPIGLDGKPVSKQLPSRLSALPPARSHCPASLRVIKYVFFKRIILQCHAHAWIKRKLEGWQAGGYHRCLGGDAGVRRLGKAECGCFLSRQIYKIALHKCNSLAAAGEALAGTPTLNQTEQLPWAPAFCLSQQLHLKSTLQLLSLCCYAAKSRSRRGKDPIKTSMLSLEPPYNQLCSRERETEVLPILQRARHKYSYFPMNPADVKPIAPGIHLAKFPTTIPPAML